MNCFEIELEIAKHNLQTLEMAKQPVKEQREIEREKGMEDPLSLSNSIKNISLTNIYILYPIFNNLIFISSLPPSRL